MNSGKMTDPELNYAKNLGMQVAKGDILFCPLCKEKLTLDYNSDDQDLCSWGDVENTLFCPHCDTNIDLIVSIPEYQMKYADSILGIQKMKTEEFNKVQKLLQKVYDENFSFLKFEKFLSHPQQMMIFVSHCFINMRVAFDCYEILETIKSKQKLKTVMRARLIDALLSTRDSINENLKRLG